jgi:2-(1,2-epoxy-1,2-dihydrophenyl)acetyl-CoA isomerase
MSAGDGPAATPDDIVLVDRQADVLTVTLNRPGAYNAINPALRDQLSAIFDGAEADGVRAILLYGAGRGFCSGADLKNAAPAAPGLDTTRVMRLSTQKLIRSFLDCPVPIVSAVHGVAAGIGLVLAFGADVCVAASDASFMPAFVQRAIVPDGGIAFLLPRLIGMARTKDFLIRGRALTGDQAAAIGLISEAVAPGDLQMAAAAVAAELAAMPTATLGLLKQMLAQSFDLDLAATLFTERAAQGLSSATDDASEGRRAFAERRAARFTGH